MPDPYDDLHYLLATHDGGLMGLFGPYRTRPEAEASVGSNPAKWLGSRGARFDVLTINRAAHPALVRALARSATSPAVDEDAVYRAAAEAIHRATPMPAIDEQRAAKEVTAALAPLLANRPTVPTGTVEYVSEADATRRAKEGPAWEFGESLYEWLRLTDAPEKFATLREYAYVLAAQVVEGLALDAAELKPAMPGREALAAACREVAEKRAGPHDGALIVLDLFTGPLAWLWPRSSPRTRPHGDVTAGG